jgi:hypothetical protein
MPPIAPSVLHTRGEAPPSEQRSFYCLYDAVEKVQTVKSAGYFFGEGKFRAPENSMKTNKLKDN